MGNTIICYKNIFEENFKLLFESAPHPYLVLLPDPPIFTIVAVNDAYLTVTNTSRSKIVGRGIFDVFPDNPNDQSATGQSDLLTSLQRVCDEKIQDIMGIQKYDIRIPGSDEFEVRYWSPINTPVFDSNRELVFIIHRAEDVTEFMKIKTQHAVKHPERIEKSIERTEAEILRSAREVKEANRELKTANMKLAQREKDLSELNERLKELDIAKTKFFSNISHEFRTPLTLMLGPLEEVLKAELKPQEVNAAVEIAFRNAGRMLKLVNNLLDFSKLEAGKMQAQLQATDLSAYTIKLAELFRSAMAKAKLDFIVDCPPLSNEVYIDREAWEKIVCNLLSNAFKHTFKGQIKISLVESRNKVILRVEDTGVGIPKEQIPNLFQRFNRISNIRSRTHEGTGIGLALVYELVKLHHGDVSVKSKVDEGTSFTVSIPQTSVLELPDSQKKSPEIGIKTKCLDIVNELTQWLPDEEQSEIIQQEAGSWETMNKKQVTILYADDNKDMQNYVSRLLKPFCNLMLAQDGEAALELAISFHPDLILSDIMMPKVDGISLLKKCKEHPQLQSVPFILISARVDPSSKVKCLNMGANDYLVKPFDRNELVARIKSNLHLPMQTILQETQKELEDAKIDNLKMQEANRVKSEFISIISHELRTPITSIKGSLGLVLSSNFAENSDKVHHLIEIAHKNSERLVRLINDILDTEKFDAGKMHFEMKEVKLRSLLLQAIDLNQNYCEKYNVYFEVPKPITECKVCVDSDRLLQVLTNLISNAAKFSTPHSKIIIETKEFKDTVRTSITNFGHGISAEFRNRIFEKFAQSTDPISQLQKGTGLGLHICKNIIERFNGQIDYQSEVDKKTTFYFDLPKIT